MDILKAMEADAEYQLKNACRGEQRLNIMLSSFKRCVKNTETVRPKL